jgi:hypothetical protein
MVRRSLKRRIDEIYSRLPPPPPPLEELPIEAWLAEIMEANAPPPAQYDEDFWRWLEELPRRIYSSLLKRIHEVWGTVGRKKLSLETAAEITKCYHPKSIATGVSSRLGKVSETRGCVLWRSYLRRLVLRRTSSPTPTPQRRSGDGWTNSKPSLLKRG